MLNLMNRFACVLILPIVFFISAIPQVCIGATASVGSVSAKQRDNRSGLVDISFLIEATGTTNILTSITLFDSSGRPLPGYTIYSDQGTLTNSCHNLMPGEHTLIWDAKRDVGNGYFSSVTVDVCVEAIDDTNLNAKGEYCVIDVSGGADVESFPIVWMDELPFDVTSDDAIAHTIILKRIPCGSFSMGEFGHKRHMKDVHDVAITKDYYIGVTEVTQRQWELVMGDRPSFYMNEESYATRPVDSVSWSAIRGSSEVYDWPTTKVASPQSFIGRLQSKTGLRIDLPTEFQWEYACRAGTTTDFNNGENYTTDFDYSGNGYGVYKGYDSKNYYNRDIHTSNGGTSRVASYMPNAWGLYDCHGNVAEWCLDKIGNIPNGAKDFEGQRSKSLNRVTRGGHNMSPAYELASGYRTYYPAEDGIYFNGFRLALNIY